MNEMIQIDVDCSKERQEFLDGKNIQEKLKQKALQLCQAFIGGQWDQAKQSDLIFTPIKGGLSNCLFLCSLKHENCTTNETNKVLIRIRGLYHNKTAQTDSLIMLLLGERNLGPKLLGVFPGGRLEQFIQSKTMVQNDLFNPLYIKGIARQLAMINCLDAPINKKSKWLIDNLHHYHSILKERIQKKDEKAKEIIKFLHEHDFDSEIQWIINNITKIESPIVFSHNDLIPANILVRNEILEKIKSDESNEKLLDQLIVIIDFECCSYNFRGCEIGNFFNGHMFQYNTPDPPRFTVDEDKYPDENHQRNFINEYLIKLKQIKGELSEIDTIDHIMKEVEFYQIGHNLFWTLLSIVYADENVNDPNSFNFWRFGQKRYEIYERMKSNYKRKNKIVE